MTTVPSTPLSDQLVSLTSWLDPLLLHPRHLTSSLNRAYADSGSNSQVFSHLQYLQKWDDAHHVILTCIHSGNPSRDILREVDQLQEQYPNIAWESPLPHSQYIPMMPTGIDFEDIYYLHNIDLFNALAWLFETTPDDDDDLFEGPITTAGRIVCLVLAQYSSPLNEALITLIQWVCGITPNELANYSENDFFLTYAELLTYTAGNLAYTNDLQHDALRINRVALETLGVLSEDEALHYRLSHLGNAAHYFFLQSDEAANNSVLLDLAGRIDPDATKLAPIEANP